MNAFSRILLSLVLVLSAASVARAQTPNRWDLSSPIKQHEAITQTPDTEVNFWKYLSAVTSGVMGAAVNQATAPAPAPNAVSGFAHMIAMMTGNPPVQTAQYIAYMGAKAGFVDQAYAQGGFVVLQPIQSIWVATRNVAYLITSLTLVVIGFMIMMRKKLDAQTVIGIQQALPSIVITLLLITFSYAIAGLMIDLLYFVLYFVLQLMASNIFTGGDPSKAIKLVTENSIFTVVLGGLFGAGGLSAETAAKAIAQLIDDLFSTGALGSAGGVVGGLVSGTPLGSLIISGALLFSMVKLFFSLLTSYAMLLLATIFGPLMLMTNAIPGSNAFGTWIKNLAGNAAVFPATAIFIILAAALMGGANTNFGIKDDVGFGSPSATTSWAPPLLFGVTSSGAAGASPIQALMALIGLGMLMLTPQFVEMVKKAFSAAGGEGYGSAIGQALQYGYSGRFSPGRLVSGGLGGAQALGGAALGLAGTQAMKGILGRRRMSAIQDFLNPNRSYQERLAEGEWDRRHPPETPAPRPSAPAGPSVDTSDSTRKAGR